MNKLNNNEYVVLSDPNKDKLSEALLMIKGASRTMAELASDTKISQSKLSRILNKNYKDPLPLPLLETLIEAACDESTVSLDDLISYNGMVSKEEARHINHTLNTYAKQTLKTQMKDIVTTSLFSRGVTIKKMGFTDNSGSYKFSVIPDSLVCDMAVSLPENDNLEWGFLMLPVVDPDDNDYEIKFFARRVISRFAFVFLRDAWTPDTGINQKISFVFSDKLYYEGFVDALSVARLNNRISAILIDISEKTVAEEHIFPCASFERETSIFEKPILSDERKYIAHKKTSVPEEDE